MVAAAFDALKDENVVTDKSAADVAVPTTKPDEIDERIVNAKSVMGLLSVAEGNVNVTRKHALKVKSFFKLRFIFVQ